MDIVSHQSEKTFLLLTSREWFLELCLVRGKFSVHCCVPEFDCHLAPSQKAGSAPEGLLGSLVECLRQEPSEF